MARRKVVASVMVAGSSVMAKATVEGGLAASLFGSLAETPVATWRPLASSSTMDQGIEWPPKGAVGCPPFDSGPTTMGADWLPSGLKVPENGDGTAQTAAPSI